MAWRGATTLMVWRNGKLGFFGFLGLSLPSVLNWAAPAAIMLFAVPKLKPAPHLDRVQGKPGMMGVGVLFMARIITAVCLKNFLQLLAFFGMMLGMGCLHLWANYLQFGGKRRLNEDRVMDNLRQIDRVEWNRVLAFFGISFAIGGFRPFPAI